MTFRWTMFDVVDGVNCAVYGHDAADEALLARKVVGAQIDARCVQSGDLFVALQGTSAHGLQFAEDAFQRGASGVLVGNDGGIDDEQFEQWLTAAAEHGPVALAVDCDGVTALGRAARAWRRRSGVRVVAITGSTGKTSTKDLLRAMLEALDIPVHASHANHNNEIGVPLTLLQSPLGTDVVICEMGMRGPGQIAYLCDIADPDVGVVTNAGTAHLELLGTHEAIVAAKAEIIGGTWTGGAVVFPADQPELPYAALRVPDRALPFGVAEDEEAVVIVTSAERTERGICGHLDLMGIDRRFDLPVHGVHNARNLAAATCAVVALIGSPEPIDDRVLSVARPTAGRGDRHHLQADRIVIDDSYNANPESMKAALTELAAVDSAKRRIAVLGAMAELGATSPTLHAEIGALAGALPIDELVLIGRDGDVEGMAQGWIEQRGDTKTIRRVDSVDDAISVRNEWFHDGDTILVKASNGVGLSRLVRTIVEQDETMPNHMGHSS